MSAPSSVAIIVSELLRQMKSTIQVTFVQSLPLSLSQHGHELQQANARAHAARVGHRKSRERPARKDDRSTNQVAIQFAWRPKASLQSPEDEARKISLACPAPTREPSDRWNLSPSSSPDAIDSSLSFGKADEDRAEQEEDYVKFTSNTISNPEWFQHPFHEVPSQFLMSPELEGFPGLRTDPFFCIPQARDRQTGSAIDFFSQVLNTGNDTVCYVFNVSNVYDSFLETLQDESFVDSGLALIQSLQEQARASESAPSIHTLKHKGTAISRLRRSLSQPVSTVDDVIICAIIFLAALEKGLRNYAAFNLHRKNIALIVSKRGGLRALRNGSVLKNYLLHYDAFWAMESGETMFPGERPRYEPVYPSRPFSMALCTIIARLPVGFQQLFIESALPMDILPLLSRATHLTYLRSHERHELLSRTRRSTKPYSDFWEACPCLYVQDDSPLTLETLLSLTLICYCYTAFGSRSYPTALRVARLEATRKIALFAPKSQAEQDCLIWMWIVFTDSWGIEKSLQPHGTVLLFDLQTRFPALVCEDAVVDIAGQFLWTPDLTRSVHMYWKDFGSARDGGESDQGGLAGHARR